MPPKGKPKQIDPSTRRLRSEGAAEGSNSREAVEDSQNFRQIIEAARRHSAAVDCEAAYAQIEQINESLSASEKSLEEILQNTPEWESLAAELENINSKIPEGPVGKVRALASEFEALSRSNSSENIAPMADREDYPPMTPYEGGEGAEASARSSRRSSLGSYKADSGRSEGALPEHLAGLKDDLEQAAKQLVREMPPTRFPEGIKSVILGEPGMPLGKASESDEDEGEEDCDEAFEEALALKAAAFKANEESELVKRQAAEIEALKKAAALQTAALMAQSEDKMRKEAETAKATKESVETSREVVTDPLSGATTKHLKEGEHSKTTIPSAWTKPVMGASSMEKPSSEETLVAERPGEVPREAFHMPSHGGRGGHGGPRMKPPQAGKSMV